MAWIVLIGSGLMESVWATALSKSEGFTHLLPSIIFVVGLALSMIGLGYAAKTLPIGTAYAVWTGIGAVTTATYAMVTGAEPVTLAKILLLMGLIGCIVGLHVVDGNS